MSVAVSLEELRSQVEAHGPAAYLVTVNLEGAPHTTSVAVAWADGTLVAGAGKRTAENTDAHPEVTLLFPPRAGNEAYCLLVDGTGRVSDDRSTVTVTPVGAVLHRLATAEGDGPSCVKVLES